MRAVPTSLPTRTKRKGPIIADGPLIYLGSPTWARTRDLRINSPALYRLSYRGTALHYSQLFKGSKIGLDGQADRAGRQWEQVRMSELVR
jgi:hypothetical protein